MTTPHRGLPPPPAMSLPSPTQAATGLGPYPTHFQGSEDVYKTWLQAKMEEERRRAEEEITRQEQYRVETRRTELEFLKESLRMGIPPPLIPVMFAGRGALKGAGRDWLNEFVAQHLGHAMQQHQQHQQYVQQQQQQQQHHQQQQQQQQQPQPQPQPPPQHHHHHHPQHSHQAPPVQHSPQAPPLRRTTRVIGQQSGGPPHPAHMGPPSAGGMTSQQVAPGLPPPPPPVAYLPPYQVPGGGHPPPPPPMQPGPLSRLPKLDTNEQRQAQQPQPPMHSGMPPGQMGGPPHGPPMPPGPPPPQQPPQSEAATSQSSPAIYFYHWVPPHSSGVGSATPVQATASPQRQLDSPFTHQPQLNQVTGSEYSHSPKKRKASTQGPVVSQPFSPSFHATPLPPASVSTPSRTRRGHSRHRSDTSGPIARGFEPYSKASRHRRSIGEGSISEGNPPATSSVGDNGGGPHHPHDPHEQQQRSRQQSVPPPSLQRPYSAGAEFRREHYPPPQPQPPPPPESGGAGGGNGDGDGRTKSGNGNGRD